jgi:hypothetical protein
MSLVASGNAVVSTGSRFNRLKLENRAWTHLPKADGISGGCKIISPKRQGPVSRPGSAQPMRFRITATSPPIKVVALAARMGPARASAAHQATRHRNRRVGRAARPVRQAQGRSERRCRTG